MKVLFWSETFWPRVGGVERLAAGLLPALRANGHEFVVVTWVDGTERTDSSFEGMHVHRFPFFSSSGRDGADRTLEHVDQVRRLKRAFAPDLVHVNSCGRSAWFHLATDTTSVPTLVTLHQPLAADTRGEDSVAGRLLSSAAWIACCSNAVLSTVLSVVPATQDRTSVIDNALPPVCAAPSPVSFEPPRLLFVGRLVSEKGLDLVLNAIAPLFARSPQARLIIAGEGPLRRQLEAQVAAQALESYVQFLGAVSPAEVRDLMAAASIVIVPSRVEGFGLVALEAALMGRPVVATRAGGLPELVRQDVTGLLADVDDPVGFVRAIERLLRDPDEARRLGAAARDRALAVFDWQRHVRAYDDLYRRLAA